MAGNGFGERDCRGYTDCAKPDAVKNTIKFFVTNLVKGVRYILQKPSWKNRRRYILASFVIGAIMLLGSTVVALTGNMSDVSDLVTGGVALITLILTSYIFGAVWEDKSLYRKEENGDG